MLTGREQETAFLENHYKRTGSQILVVYGQRGVGKTALLTSFTEKKQTLRYSAGNCSSREQQYLWGRELRSRGKEIAEYPSWRELLECMTIQKGETTADKKVLIIENFQYLLKGDTLFLQELIRFLKEKKEALLVILTTYASGWVENSMISKVGNLAFSVSGFLKVKELPFAAMRKIFSDYTVQESISLYATLGGLPGLWRLLYPQNSAEENLILLAGLSGARRKEARARTEALLESLQLQPVARRRAKTLSGGFQRRLSIAMALISQPQVLFLDEPTLGLDVLARRELWQVIQELKGQVTVVLTTHYLEEAQALADSIGILSRGRLTAQGTAEALIRRSGQGNLEDAFVALTKGSDTSGEEGQNP